jgi:hypothetical protein
MRPWTAFSLTLSLIVLSSLAQSREASGSFGPLVRQVYSATAQPSRELSNLPMAAQVVVSATLGHDDARYQVTAAPGGLHARTRFKRCGRISRRRGCRWVLMARPRGGWPCKAMAMATISNRPELCASSSAKRS